MTAALIAVGVFAAGAPVSAQGDAPNDVTWQSAGDSYSSGEGVPENKGPCAQSEKAYGPATANALREVLKWGIANETFTACTGHLVEDYFHARGDTGASDPRSLWDWGRDQGGPERVDVLTMSFGGNDIGFADVISDCLVGLPDSWGEFILGGIASSATGCDISEAELNKRADHLVDPARRNCDTNRRQDKAYDCDLAIQGRRGSIIDFYYDVVTNQLTDRGRLYVVGYPRIFADTDQWSRWTPLACAGVKRGDTQKLGRAAEHLNNKLQDAVRRANEALGSDRVVFVDRFAYYRDGQHELCGRGEDWLNGIATDRGDWTIRKETSFHPNEAGHDGIATELVGIVDRTFPRPQPPPIESASGAELTEITDPQEFLEAFFAAWLRNDVAEMYRFGPPELIDEFRSSFPPSDYDDFVVAWSDACLLGSSAAGGCDVSIATVGGGYGWLLGATYHEVDTQGHLQLDEITSQGSLH